MKRRVLVPAAIFVISLAVYNSNMSALWYSEMYDTIGTKLLPFALLSGRGFDLSDFADTIYKDTDASRYFVRYKDWALPWSPVGGGVLVTPLYIPYVLHTLTTRTASIQTWYEASFAMEKISASILASVNNVLMYILLFALFGKVRTAFWGSLLFAFGTQQWSTNSQFLWSHGPATTLFLVSQLLYVRGLPVPSLIVGLFIMFIRYPLAVYPVLLATSMAFESRRKAKLYAALASVCACFFLFHVVLYGNVLGPYADRFSTFDIWHMMPNMAGILFSFGRGIVWFTPFVLFFVRLKDVLKFRFHALFVLCIILGISTWNIWWGGASFGDRLLSDIGVSVVILAIAVYKSLHIRLWQFVFYMTVIWSVAVHGLGAFSLGVDGWNSYPVSIDSAPYRVWDITDTPMARALAVGFPRYGWQRIGYKLAGVKEQLYDPVDRACSLQITGMGKRLGYTVAYLAFTNNSDNLIVTAGPNLVRLRAIYRSQETSEVVTSPIADSGLPGVISPGQTVATSMVIIEPNETYSWRVTIIPVQEGYSWWGGNCSASTQI